MPLPAILGFSLLAIVLILLAFEQHWLLGTLGCAGLALLSAGGDDERR